MSVIRAFNIPDTFDEAVLEEARSVAQLFDETAIGSRQDLRDVRTVTIDPANARDFDDAISLSRDEQGHWSLGVHIADVAHFVRPASALDRVARNRGTSVYLPDRVIPMLPEILSNSLASLQAGRTRYTVSAFLDYSPEGILTGKRFARSAIKVDHRFSYEQALPVMKQPAAPCSGVAAETAAMLGLMLELAMILRRRRFHKGALELSLPEVEIELAPDGTVSGARLAQHDESHQVIEEFMLAANEAVACTLSENETGFLRRAHPVPEPFKLDEFAEFARSLGLEIDQPQSRFELQRVLHETIGKPEEYAVHYGLLRSLKQAYIHARARSPLRLSQRELLPFHLADQALSRPAGAPPVDRLARGQKAQEPSRRALRAGPALHSHRAPRRSRRARFDPVQAAGLSQRSHRPDLSRDHHRRGRVRSFLPAL